MDITAHLSDATQQERTARRSVAAEPAGTGATSYLLELQRQVGNQAVGQLLRAVSLGAQSRTRIQRDDDLDAGGGGELPQGGTPDTPGEDRGGGSSSSRVGQNQISIATQSVTQDGLGHAWVMLERANGKRDSFGFWPASFTLGSALKGLSFNGAVHHPDTAYSPEAKETTMVDDNALQDGIDYAKDNADATYNLLAYNCATFARGMYRAATGQSAPSGGILIDSPKDLRDHIEQQNRDRGMDPNENPLPQD